MKIKTTLYIHYRKYSWEDTATYVAMSYKCEGDPNTTFVCEQVVELEVPDGYDPTAQKIAALEDQKAKASKDYHLSVERINLQISKLQALEYTA